jgi:hypothetical protein
MSNLVANLSSVPITKSRKPYARYPTEQERILGYGRVEYRYRHKKENREQKRVSDYIRKTVGIENLMIGDQIVNEPIHSNRHIFGKTRYMMTRQGKIVIISYAKKRSRNIKGHTRLGRLLKDYKLYSGRPRKTAAEKKQAKHDYNVQYYLTHSNTSASSQPVQGMFC